MAKALKIVPNNLKYHNKINMYTAFFIVVISVSVDKDSHSGKKENVRNVTNTPAYFCSDTSKA